MAVWRWRRAETAEAMALALRSANLKVTVIAVAGLSSGRLSKIKRKITVTDGEKLECLIFDQTIPT